MQRSIRQPVHTTAALLLPSSINNHTHSLAAILIQEKKKKNLSIPFASPVLNMRTMLSSPYLPQYNRTTLKHRQQMLSICQFRPTSPLLLPGQCLMPLSSLWNLEAMPCCHYRGSRKNLLPLQLKHTKNPFNAKYIPLKQITGYQCSSANNVRIIVRQLIAVRQIEATGLILLKQWNKKLLAKQIIGKFFNLLCSLSLHH